MTNQEIEFPCPFGKDKLKRIQFELVDLFKHINQIFIDNNIRFFIMYGSLLGAVRHQGFIPWDDDFDIAIHIEDYEKAVQLLREKLLEKYVVHDKLTDPIYWLPYSKVRYVNSEGEASIWTRGNAFKYRGISIDLFRIQEGEASTFHAKKYKYKSKAVIKYRKMPLYQSWIKKGQILISLLPSVIFYYFYKFLDKIAPKKRCYLCDPEILSVPLGLDTLFPVRKITFENVETFAPAKAEEVLTAQYGDYLTMPPVKKRVQHISSITFFD